MKVCCFETRVTTTYCLPAAIVVTRVHGIELLACTVEDIYTH